MSKFVDFTYCYNCMFEKKEESEMPCFECLTVPAREESEIPICFKAKTQTATEKVKKK